MIQYNSEKIHLENLAYKTYHVINVQYTVRDTLVTCIFEYKTTIYL